MYDLGTSWSTCGSGDGHGIVGLHVLPVSVCFPLWSYFYWAGEMARWLRASSALAKDLNAILRIHVQQFIAACNSSSRGSDSTSGLWGGLTHVHMYTHTYNFNFKKCVCVCMHTHIPLSTYGGQRTICRIWFSPSTVRVLGLFPDFKALWKVILPTQLFLWPWFFYLCFILLDIRLKYFRHRMSIHTLK